MRFFAGLTVLTLLHSFFFLLTRDARQLSAIALQSASPRRLLVKLASRGVGEATFAALDWKFAFDRATRRAMKFIGWSYTALLLRNRLRECSFTGPVPTQSRRRHKKDETY